MDWFSPPLVTCPGWWITY